MIRKKKKRRLFFCLILGLLLFLAWSVRAESSDAEDPNAMTQKEESDLLAELETLIPPEARILMPDSWFSEKGGLRELNPGFLTGIVQQLIRGLFPEWLGSLAALSALILVSSLLHQAGKNLVTGKNEQAVSFVSALCLSLAFYGIMQSLWKLISSTMDQLQVFMASVIPIMTGLYAMGGNVSAATVGSAGMMASLTTIGAVCAGGLYPVLRVCFGLALITAIGGGIDLSGVGGLIRGIFTTALTFLMTLFSLVIACQTHIALVSDSAAARTVRFAAVNLIPVVGGTVGEAMRLVMGSFRVIKQSAGILTVLALLLLVLPVLIKLLLYRFGFQMIKLLAQILGCDREAGLIGEMQGLLGYALALITVCTLLFVLNVTLVIQSAVSVVA